MRRALLLLPLLLAGCGGGSPSGPRNVLVITLDTVRRDSVGFHGASPSPSPRLDAIAEESIVFEDAYTVAPLTLPAHTSLFTGLYPASHGVRDNDVMRVPAAADTLAETLEANGYRCLASVAAFVLDEAFGLNQGFATYRAPGRRTVGGDFAVPQVRGNVVVDQGIAALDELAAGEGPWMMWLHLYDPHAPYDPSGSGGMGVSEDRASYEGEIRYADSQLGRLVDELQRRDLWDDLIVVFASDHGEGLDDGREPSHGFFVHDTTMRIPMFVRHPELAARRVETQASLVDVVPTLLGLLDIPYDGRQYDGRDLGPAARGEAMEDAAIQFECYKPWVDHGWAPYEGIVDGSWKLVRSRDNALFDRATDPGEDQDLYDAEGARAAELTAELDRRLEGQLTRMAGETVRLDAAAEQALAALGYAGGEGFLTDRPEFEELADPAGKFPLIMQMHVLAVKTATGDTAGAIASLQELCNLDPGSAVFAERLGLALLGEARPDLDQAEAYLQRAARLRSERPRVHLGLSRLYGMRSAEARQRMAVHQRDGQNDLALAAQGEWREFQRLRIAELRLVLQLENTNPQAMFNLAIALCEDGDFYRGTGQTALAQTVYSEAGTWLDRMLAIVPDDDPRLQEARAFRQTVAERIRSVGG